MAEKSEDGMYSNNQLRQLLEGDLARLVEEQELSLDRAFLHLCLEYLGFEAEMGVVTDGSGDFGIDFIEVSNTGVSIIQSKSFVFEEKIDFDKRLGPETITDLPRIRSVLASLDEPPTKVNAKLKRVLGDLKFVLRSASQVHQTDKFNITVYFCAQGAGLTSATEIEFKKLDTSDLIFEERALTISYIPVFFDDLLEAKWRETNTKWRNRNNEKRERFDLDVCGELIKDSSKSCVFFTRACQLIDAYSEIGYQLFESNVRCEIKNSPVNKEIRSSILSHRGREEFKHLNNGITLICDSFSYSGPKDRPTGLRVTHPGVINGLQTIKTLADAVLELSSEDYQHFSENCLVLTRVHTQNSVNNYRDLVKSTNNQNPMKPRNLRSNDTEQVLLERYFSENLGWFYERKEGAWNAFKSDHSRWSTINHRPQHFLNGKIVKKVDNEEIAQAWLSFIGFSEHAVDQKRYLFSAERPFYDLVFLNRPSRHGIHYGHRPVDPKVVEEGEAQPPVAEGMLAAYIVREFAKSVVRTRKENREETIARLGLSGKSAPEQETILSKDTEYLKGLILRGMLLLFVEYFGYTMFETFGGEVHKKFRSLLQNGSFAEIRQTGNFDVLKSKYYEKQYTDNDVLMHIWEVYNHLVSQMTAGAWFRERQNTSNRSKFIYSDVTRQPLFKEHVEANQIFSEKLLTRKWSIPINEAGGIEKFIKKSLL